MPLHRTAICYIAFGDLLQILDCQNVRLEGTDVPPNARVVNVFIDYPRNMLGVVLEHLSFEPVPVGQQMPILGTGKLVRVLTTRDPRQQFPSVPLEKLAPPAMVRLEMNGNDDVVVFNNTPVGKLAPEAKAVQDAKLEVTLDESAGDFDDIHAPAPR